MSHRTSIIKNTAWLFAAETVSTVLLSIGGLLLARAWGNVVYGIYGFSLSFVALFAFLIDFGLPSLLINELSQRREQIAHFVKNFSLFKVVLALTALLLIAGSIALSKKTPDVQEMVVLLACNTIAGSFISFYYSIFRAFEQMKFEAAFKMAFNAVSLALIVVVLIGHWTVRSYILGSTILTLVNLIILLRLLSRSHPLFSAPFDGSFIRHTFRQALPLALSTVFISIYFSLDSVMLSFWKNDETVGWYSADYRVVFLIMTFVNLFYAATFPVISRLLQNDKQSVRVILAMSLRIIITLVLPATIALSLLAPKFVPFLFGAPYAPGSKALAILIWTVCISGISVTYSNTVLAAGHRTLYAIGTAIGAVLNTLLNFFLIPRWSLNGAATATVITEVVVLIFFAYYCNRRIVHVPIERRLITPLLLSLLLIPLFLFARSLPVHFLITGGAIGLLYFCLLFAFRSVSIRDITDVTRSLRSKESVISE